MALRHGLPGALLGFVFLVLPATFVLLAPSLNPALTNLFVYVLGGCLIFGAILVYQFVRERCLDVWQIGWALYLLGVSLWEEWVFRIALPYWLTDVGLDFRTAVIGSNLAFGLMHYFTLRWKWQWCVLAFLGGLGLSRNYMILEDFMLIVAIHWIATYINTPRYPGQSRA